MAADFTVNFNPNAVMARFEGAEEFALFALSEQVIMDSNYYCKEDFGVLKESAISNSIPEQGIVQWTMPYAEKQYYLPSACLDKNPNACMMWFHKAKDIHLDEWITLYERTLRGGI